MLRNTSKLLQISNGLQNILKVQLCGRTPTPTENWDLLTAVCIERRPIITPELNKLEKEYKQLLDELELERSLKSDTELRHEADMKNLELLRKGEDIADKDTISKQTLQDLVDLWNDEASKFKPANKITEADKKNDLKSLNRKLDKHLVFVLNQKVGDKNFYILPQGAREDGETLRQTADRVLRQNVGTDVKVQIYGNAPCGFYKYKYPGDIKNETGTVGAKVFIYFARYLGGQLTQTNLDYKWLDRTELQKTLPPQYNTSVKQFLFDG
ncbi:unnamed protein product [Phaedon cochleariae]|uniref:Large ribosomal subunit protein mL46 n=1 Tax=Phaedon cochleariae TaxID=80249 RepID=A0A9P0DAU0_PHACE|nr:unnamed protein product [Phaedon cochleariae]